MSASFAKSFVNRGRGYGRENRQYWPTALVIYLRPRDSEENLFRATGVLEASGHLHIASTSSGSRGAMNYNPSNPFHAAKYKRPRGFIEDWNPQKKTLSRIMQVKAILAEYQDSLPMTGRQIFYRLVGAYGYDKTEKAYTNLAEMLNKARRARVIPFDAIRDDGFQRSNYNHWDSIDLAKNAIRYTASKFQLNKQTGQESRLVVWCEAGGMTQQLESVCHPYSVPVVSSGGFDSVTVKHDLAQEFSNMDSDIVVLHIGDHDPSGVHVFSSLDEDITAFLDDMGGDAEFIRLAVTPEHIRLYGLPTSPAKTTDRRSFEGETVQAEALPPDILARILENAIHEHMDMEIYAEAIKQEEQHRQELLIWLGGGAQ